MSDLEELDGIAIIGMTCRLPGANDIDEYWQKLRNGVECISFFSDEELLAAGVDPVLLANPDYVKAAGVIDDIDQFDASFFGFSPREAEATDPQHRVFIECAWTAIEDAGYNPETYEGAIGVFAGVGQNNYLLENLLSNPDILESVGPIQTSIGNNKDFVPTRVSYKLNLKGPSLNIQTACSTSLVATHMACQSLLSGECDMALAGGASITALKKQGYLYQQAGIYSSDGHCKAFDADANGMVGSNGVAVILLKRLDEAVEDGDSIYAVIRGSAINNDGSAKVGITAPSVEGQSQVIAEALAIADVEPETITYVETHGTGTNLGDPIEVAALTNAFKSMTSKKGYCGIGSVKTNIGHTDAAAGCAGIIKTALSLQHSEIPPSINFERPNPEIDFANSPFYVNHRLQAWESTEYPLRAGVSAFGIGGTNAHVILEQAPQPEASSDSRSWQLLMLSARTAKALDEASENLLNYLETHLEQNLADIAYTLTVGRKTFDNKRILVCQDLNDAREVLQTKASGRLFTLKQDQENRPVAFMFSGQGAQYANMLADLYQSETIFRKHLDACAEGLLTHIEVDIRTLIFPEAGQEEVVAEQLAQTHFTQPALFAIEFSLAQLWMSWGVQPLAMIGHSLGEYVAACIAEVMTLADALELVAMRGRLMMMVAGDGAMLAVHKPEQEVEKYLDESLSLAAVNAPDRCVISGPTKAIEQLERELQNNDEPCARLHTSHAFHSSMMDPIVEQFVQAVSEVKLNKPQLPFISCTTGTWITDEEATDPEYWGRHIRQGVRFSDGVRELLSVKQHVLLEVGPGTTLTSLAKMQSDMGAPPSVVASTRHPREKRSDVEVILGALGKLWQAGASIDWSAFYSGQHRKRLHLPTYPFQRRRYWIEPGKHSLDTVKKNPDISQWFYVPSWKRTAVPQISYSVDTRACYLLFIDDVGVGKSMAQHLVSNGQRVITVSAGEGFNRSSDNTYSIHPQHPSDYETLIKTLAEQNAYPDYIAHCWSISKNSYQPGNLSGMSEGFFSLVHLAQALGKQADSRLVCLTVFTNAMYTVMGDEINQPVKAMILGPTMVLPHENPNIRSRCVDLPVGIDYASIVESLSAELHHTKPDRSVAYRCGQRWLQTVSSEYQQLPTTALPDRLREGGVYLITGGLGGIGLTIAEYLVKAASTKLVLVSRSTFPEHEQWSQWLLSHEEDDLTSKRIKKLQDLEKHGAEIMICRADVANQEQMDQLMVQIKDQFGTLHGVIHAAGTAEGGMIQLETRESALTAMAPKVQGTEILHALCKSFNCDFMLLCSSLATLLEGAGAADYCAANAFMDAFAQHCNVVDDMPVISVNWDAWQQIGMAVNTKTSKQLQTQRDETLSKGILPEEGMQVFARVLDTNQPQFLISTHELEERIRQHVIDEMESIEGEEDVLTESQVDDDRPDLDNDYVAPESETEKAVTAIWRKLFGIQQIGIHDNFFQLGGDSLLATQLLNKLNHNYAEAKLALSNLFENPTIAGLSKIIVQSDKGEVEEPAKGNSGKLLDESNTQPSEPDKNIVSELFEVSGLVEPAQHIDAASSQALTIPRRDPGTIPLASFAQQRLWYLDQLDPGNPVYNIPLVYHLQGVLNVDALTRSLNEIIHRHEVLRTTFSFDHEIPTQVIASELTLELPVIDVAAEDLDKILKQQSVESFDLEKGPLVRAHCYRLNSEQHVFLLVAHHTVFDGLSLRVLMEELQALYQAFTNQKPSPLPPLSVQYADFAVWQRDWLQGEELERQIAYWKKQLGGELPVLELPTDKPRPSTFSYRGAIHKGEFSSDLLEPLVKQARSEGVTLFMLLLAAYVVLMNRYTRQDDLVVGTPIGNRNRGEIENLIGFFVNTLALRIDLSGDPSFHELLAQVRDVALGAFDHQDLPFEKLVEEIQPSRDTSRPPVFQVMFSVQQAANSKLEFPELEVTLQDSYNGTTKFDLTLYVTVSEKGMMFTAEYATDLFNAETIERLLKHYEVLLSGIVKNPDLAISELPLLTEAERVQMAELNSTAMDYDQAACLHTLISSQATRTPDALAVMAVDGQLSYRELEQRTNQLAHYLQTLGVEPDVRVGVCLERSTDMLVGVLGILKAGGVYVPLDPDFPHDRLAFMLEDAQVPVLITQTSLKADLPDCTARIIDLHQDRTLLDQQPDTIPNSNVGPQHLAYVIYTSGSTGKPKGVQVPHGAVVNFLNSMAVNPGCTESDTLLAVTTLSFDIAVLELYLPLIVGGTTVIASRDEANDGLLLKERLENSGVTIMQATPASWRLLLAAGWQGTKGFKILCGGEALPRDLVDELIQRVGKVWNMYGPTETTVWSTCYPLTEPNNPILIGKPIANTQVYVLDANQRPVPIGVPGELYIGGNGVTRGYLNRAELTSERFIKDPFISESAAMMYRTGDLVCLKEDGNLEYLERLDNQVKVRGYRIELGEIETVLINHVAVQEGVVLVREDNPGDVRLVAYYIPQAGGMVTVTELRKHLRASLPDYMIPQHFIELDSLPLTPNGKIDRKALPAPFAVSMTSEQEYTAPGTETEKRIADIWMELIGVKQVSTDDNFFELGGHSLLAMQAIARIRDCFGVRISPMTMVMHTLQDIASECEVFSSQVGNEKKHSGSLSSRVIKKIKDTIIRG